jgi:hypothetical protein
MIKLYSFFHLNLLYSSIEKASRKDVIQKCYWPLFNLAELGVPIGIEAPAITLEIINTLDPDWVASLSKYISAGKIEYIGSGYSQVIGPLVPAKVNEWNQKLGLEHYRKLLGVTPKVALVNEMAYSSGIIEHYVNVGYEGIIMEWNNPRSAHPEWENEWRYHPQKAIGNDGTSTPLIWADSIAFQKFQRYAHGEYGLNDYVKYMRTHVAENERYFPLYSNDVEIFDYRPKRYHTENQFNNFSEWGRIIELYSYLNEQDWCEFVFPSNVLNDLNNENGGKKLALESPNQPILVKKQEKYNINRWALTGQDDVGINTKCYRIFHSFVENDNINPQDLEELCYLWSSDFRTHITDKRWNNFYERLDLLLAKCEFTNCIDNEKSSEIMEFIDDKKWISVENNKYKVVFSKDKGLTIQSLAFKKFGKESLFGTLDHGYYDDITLGADYYSGHAAIERPSKHKVTDLGKVKPEIIESDHCIKITTDQKRGAYTFNQTINFKNDKITFEKTIETDSLEKAIIKPYSFTFNPKVWDRESLYIATHNGGAVLEKFFLKGQNFSHGDIYSSLISARHGFGNTEGVFVIGDKDKSICFECDMSVSALIPSIIYKEMDGTYFLRLQYSARELDETVKNLEQKHINIHVEVSFDNTIQQDKVIN